MLISTDVYFKTVFEWLSLAWQFASRRILLEHSDFLNIDISQGSVSTRLGCGGVFKYDFVANFLLSVTVEEFWKSVNIWRSYGLEYSVLFIDSRFRTIGPRFLFLYTGLWWISSLSFTFPTAKTASWAWVVPWFLSSHRSLKKACDAFPILVQTWKANTDLPCRPVC